MKKLIFLVLIVVTVWQYNKYKSNSYYPPPANNTASSTPITSNENNITPPSVSTSSFKCDGRTHCSQMTSCEEATFFLKNCPNVKMDGDGNGIPCEKQWCKR